MHLPHTRRERLRAPRGGLLVRANRSLVGRRIIRWTLEIKVHPEGSGLPSPSIQRLLWILLSNHTPAVSAAVSRCGGETGAPGYGRRWGVARAGILGDAPAVPAAGPQSPAGTAPVPPRGVPPEGAPRRTAAPAAGRRQGPGPHPCGSVCFAGMACGNGGIQGLLNCKPTF